MGDTAVCQRSGRGAASGAGACAHAIHAALSSATASSKPCSCSHSDQHLVSMQATVTCRVFDAWKHLDREQVHQTLEVLVASPAGCRQAHRSLQNLLSSCRLCLAAMKQKTPLLLIKLTSLRVKACSQLHCQQELVRLSKRPAQCASLMNLKPLTH